MMLLILMMTLLRLLFKLLSVVAEEESNNQGGRTGYRGSVISHNIVNRNKKKGELRLYNDYFAENPKFTESQFRRRFRISRRLFFGSQIQ